MFDWIIDLLSSPSLSPHLGYLLIWASIAFDAVVPVLPSETAVIAGAILAARGDLVVWWVGVAAAAGGITGDLLAYLIGRRLGMRAVRRFLRGERWDERIDWASRQLGRHGDTLVLVCRFVPWARTVVTLSAGTLAFPLRRFIALDAAGAVAWAITHTAIGYLAAQAFAQSFWRPLLVSLAIAAVLGVIAEGIRRRRAPTRGEEQKAARPGRRR